MVDYCKFAVIFVVVISIIAVIAFVLNYCKMYDSGFSFSSLLRRRFFSLVVVLSLLFVCVAICIMHETHVALGSACGLTREGLLHGRRHQM